MKKKTKQNKTENKNFQRCIFKAIQTTVSLLFWVLRELMRSTVRFVDCIEKKKKTVAILCAGKPEY